MTGRRKPEVVDLGKLRLRREVGEKIYALLEDPLRPGRLKYGALKNLSDRLFAEYLRDMDALGQDVLDEILEEGKQLDG